MDIVESPMEIRMRLELAKTGTFNDIKLTKADLSGIADTFSDDVQVVIGHDAAIWRDDAPAVGWIKSVEPVKNTLVGEVELTEEGQRRFDSGEFRKWSMGIKKSSMDGPWVLDHLALLGARSPAIKGLRVVEFAEGAPAFRAEFHNSFKENDIMDIEKIKEELRAEFATKSEADKAEFARIQAEKDAEIAALKDKAAKAERAEFASKVNATFAAAEGKIPAEKANDVKALFSKEGVTLAELLDGVNAMFAAMPPMVATGKNTPVGDAPKPSDPLELTKKGMV